MRFSALLTTTAAATALAVSSAAAQQQQQQPQAQQQGQQQQGGEKIDIVGWAAADLYTEGWTAEQLFDRTVYGEDGEEAGEVENLIIGPDGSLEALIVESGGFLDIGDTHYRVPWDQVQLTPELEGVTVPVTADNIEQFSVFQEDEEDVPQRGWRADELIGDYVSLADYPAYGMVQDLLFQNGELTSVIVYPDVGYGVWGPYAYPYYGYGRGFEPGAETYELPYARTEIEELGPFDYSRLPAGMPGARGQGQAGMTQTDQQTGG